MMHILTNIAWGGAIILGLYFLVVMPIMVIVIWLRDKATDRRFKQEREWHYPIPWVGAVLIALAFLALLELPHF